MGNPAQIDWAEALFKQACCDYYNGARILKTRMSLSRALVVSQLQQSLEKSLKALVMIELRKRATRDKKINDTHTVWRDFFKQDRFRGLRGRILAASGMTTEEIEELENLAPTRASDKRNSEYPWEEDGTKIIPAEAFDDAELLLWEGLVKAIVGVVSDQDLRMQKIQKAVELQTKS